MVVAHAAEREGERAAGVCKGVRAEREHFVEDNWQANAVVERRDFISVMVWTGGSQALCSRRERRRSVDGSG